MVFLILKIKIIYLILIKNIIIITYFFKYQFIKPLFNIKI